MNSNHTLPSHTHTYTPTLTLHQLFACHSHALFHLSHVQGLQFHVVLCTVQWVWYGTCVVYGVVNKMFLTGALQACSSGHSTVQSHTITAVTPSPDHPHPPREVGPNCTTQWSQWSASILSSLKPYLILDRLTPHPPITKRTHTP